MAEHRAPQADSLRREVVRTPDEVAAMLRLHALGWEPFRDDLHQIASRPKEGSHASPAACRARPGPG
jgi:hypothetical protein